MHFYTTLGLLSILGSSFAEAKFNRADCQAPSANPLDGCPKKTLLVGPNEEYTTIQSAVLALPPNNSTWHILVLPGNYTEKVNVTRPGPLTLMGQTPQPNNGSANTVNVIWHNATAGITGTTEDNTYTATLTIAPTLNASFTGAGPQGSPVAPGTPYGNKDFRAYNLNFINDYLPYSSGPSLALSVSYANANFLFCNFASYQDTIYIGKLGNAYIYNSSIAGQTDFLYGFGTLWIQSSTLLLQNVGGGITAWKGTNTTFENRYGVYVVDSWVKAANASIASTIVHKAALGRPWNAQIRAVFANTYLDASIIPAGFIEWSTSDPRINNYTFQAEYNSYGPGWNLTGRLAAGNISKVLTKEEYIPYSTPGKVFQRSYTDGAFGYTGWIDKSPEA